MVTKKIYTTGVPQENKLLLFFAGWGMDEYPFMRYLPTDRDCVICYDYRTLSFDDSLLAGYRDIRIVAWSMGVWAASHVLPALELPFTEKVAVNGTLLPVDEEKGIAPAIFHGTLQGLTDASLQKFRRRMCGTREALGRFMENPPQRSVNELKEELARIGELSQDSPAPSCAWDKVYIGWQDKIFLPANQQRAWEGNDVYLLDCEHYPETYWKELF